MPLLAGVMASGEFHSDDGNDIATCTYEHVDGMLRGRYESGTHEGVVALVAEIRDARKCIEESADCGIVFEEYASVKVRCGADRAPDWRAARNSVWCAWLDERVDELVQQLDQAHKQVTKSHGLMALRLDGGIGVRPESMERTAYVEAVINATRDILDCDAAIDVAPSDEGEDAAERDDMAVCPAAGASADTGAGWTCAVLRAADEAIAKVHARGLQHKRAHAEAAQVHGEAVARGQEGDTSGPGGDSDDEPGDPAGDEPGDESGDESDDESDDEAGDESDDE